MSLEVKIAELNDSICRLIDAINSQQVGIVSPTVPTVQPTQVVTDHGMHVAQVEPVVPVAPAMPSFVTAPATPVVPVAPPVSGAPFSDGKGLMEYVMNTYKALGPQKGAAIQNVLTGLGYANINDVKLEHYAALFQGIELLKTN